MAPEAPRNLQVLDLRRTSRGFLATRYSASAFTFSFLVKWYPIGAAPKGFKAVDDGVLYVPEDVSVEVDGDVTIQQVSDGSLVYKNPGTDMTAMLLPDRHRLSFADPCPEEAKTFRRPGHDEEALAVYWMADRITWAVDRTDGDLQRCAEEICSAGLNKPPRFRLDDWDYYDVALSYASEDREYADDIATRLKRAGKHVFYDHDEAGVLWGKDLKSVLESIYERRAKYCVMLISRRYASKMWTNVERRAALRNAAAWRGREYVLPVRVDETTAIEGLPESVVAFSIKDGVGRICDEILRRLQGS